MVTVDPKKTVKITAMPESDTTTNELAQYMRETLRKRSKIQDVKLD